MRARTSRPNGESGSVLLLIIGLVVIAGLFVTIVLDVSTLFLDRRDLMAAADGAALAGAQGIDEGSIYRDGLPSSGPVTLNRARAESMVNDYLENQGIVDRFDNLVVVIEVTDTTVSVHLTSDVKLPIVNTVTPGAHGGVSVDAQATARSAVIS